MAATPAPWRLDDFVRSHTSLSERTLAAYRTDLRLFAEWVARNQLATVQLSGRWPKVGQQKGEAELPAAGAETRAREWLSPHDEEAYADL